jgi:hypothetical protein
MQIVISLVSQLEAFVVIKVTALQVLTAISWAQSPTLLAEHQLKRC